MNSYLEITGFNDNDQLENIYQHLSYVDNAIFASNVEKKETVVRADLEEAEITLVLVGLVKHFAEDFNLQIKIVINEKEIESKKPF